MADQTTAGANPPRPGDPVPEGGLDPTQVFTAPPPPPPAQGDQGQGGQGDDGALPQDSGPPPPPVGTVATKEMGYDDEDIRVLGEVKEYRFGTIASKLANEHISTPCIK
jgi:hypothetical protein